MSEPQKTALIVGAGGVVGRAALSHFTGDPQWRVIGAARTPPALSGAAIELSLDLRDREECLRKLSEYPDINHVFYTAYLKGASAAEEVETNLGMLVNLVDALEAKVPGLRHINLMHGQKWYGNHLGPYRTPAKEDDCRHMPPNFYYDQQDFISDRQIGKSWTWSALRPQAPLVASIGSPMNQLLIIGLYGSICRALGVPLHFPGSLACYNALYQITDASLLARSMAWVATQPQCANEPFNVTNGDLFRWRHLWPRFADFFNVEMGDVRPISLARVMADKSELWAEMVAEHGLQVHAMSDLVDWSWGDFVFNSGYDNVSSTLKLRQSGFTECYDSENCYLDALQKLRKERFIP